MRWGWLPLATLLTGGLLAQAPTRSGGLEINAFQRALPAPGDTAPAITRIQYPQALAQVKTDESGGARYGNGAAVGDQAEATLRRNSSVIALSTSGSWAAMKSRRALARDNLPEEVFGREWTGASST